MRVAIRDTVTPSQWGMQVKEANGNTVRLSIMSSAKAIIGPYEVFIETKGKDSSGDVYMSRYKHKEEIYILFNAWCAGNGSYSLSVYTTYINEYINVIELA